MPPHENSYSRVYSEEWSNHNPYMLLSMKPRVEEIGIFFESTGLTPMEARVFSCLLLADPPEQDFFAIQEYLGASKSTISNALKRLMNEGRVDYITKPGDRKRYFRISPERWLEHIQKAFDSMTPYVNTMRRVLQLREYANSPDFDSELDQILRYFEYLEDELPRIVANWEARQLRSVQ